MICRVNLESFGDVSREGLKCYKLSLMRDLVKTQNTRILIEMQTMKARLRQFQLGTRTPLATEFKTVCVMLWQKVCLHFSHALKL